MEEGVGEGGGEGEREVGEGEIVFFFRGGTSII